MAESSGQADLPVQRHQRPTRWDETTRLDKTSVPQPTLTVSSGGGGEGNVLEIRQGSQSIGRQPDCDLCIDDRLVSRRHAIVVRDGKKISIHDAGSANGTSVNGEPLHATPRMLRPGDVVRVGRVDLIYSDGLGLPVRPPGEQAQQVPQGRQGSDDFSPLAPPQLVLNAGAAAVIALVLSGLHVDRFGKSWPGSLAAAAITSVVSTVVNTLGHTQGRMDWGGGGRAARWGRLAGATGLAFALAVTAVSLPELGLHHALTNPDRPATFVPPQLTPPTTIKLPSGPAIVPNPNPVGCPNTVVGQAGTCPVITIRSTGSATLLVRSWEVVGQASGEFHVVTDAPTTDTSGGAITGPSAVTDCRGKPLAHDATCTIVVSFQPEQTGLRTATLIVHQNLPNPDTGTQVDLIGHGVTEPTTT